MSFNTMNIPDDVLQNILEYDGRWRKDNEKWISIFHMSDSRYWLLDNMIRWSQFNEYVYPDSGRRSYHYADRIGYIFPITNENVQNHDRQRFLHINKIIVYDKNIDSEKQTMNYKSKFNIMRIFTSSLSCHLDSSDSYCSSSDDDYDDHHQRNEYIE